MAGPTIRTDIIDVYVFRRAAKPRGPVMFLQLLRAKDVALPDTWQPVMGHIEQDEKAWEAAVRELREETGYARGAGLLNLWQLETPNIFFLHTHEAIVMSPCFAAEVSPEVEPTLDATHQAARWIPHDAVGRAFLWPGQRQAIRQVMEDVLSPTSPVERLLRINEWHSDG